MDAFGRISKGCGISSDGNDSLFSQGLVTGNNGSVTFEPAIIGQGFKVDGDNHFSVNGYTGISGINPRSISLWVKTGNKDGGFIGWGDTSDKWDFGWNQTGPFVKIDNNHTEQGRFTLDDNSWHHVAVSLTTSADLNDSMLFVNGRSVDVPSLSTSSSVNTVSSGILNIGSNYNGNLDTNGTFDEVRISSIERGSAWFKNS